MMMSAAAGGSFTGLLPKNSNLQLKLFERQFDNNIFKFQSNVFRERLRIAKNLYKFDLISHFGCVNAIEFSNGGDYLVSGGDDKRVLLWNLEKAIAEKGQPRAMDKEHQSNIFCLNFNRDNSKIFSGGNDDVVIVHDVRTGKTCDVYLHLKPVYGLSVDPTNDNIISTAGEDGRVLLFDQRRDIAALSLGKYRGPCHAVQFHPQDGNFLVTANSKKGAAFWDIRKPQSPMIQYGGEGNQQSCMSIRFNTTGNQVLVLRRRLPPILYNTFSQNPVCQFYHPDYYNSCTMKSCCFAGEDDEFVLSGSDDFNLYVWRVGDVDLNLYNQWIEKTQMVLYGHRSIVNQVRYNPQKCLLASSGVEKIVKLWSPFQQKNWIGSLTDEANGSENPREVFSHDAYFSLVHMNWTSMTHDYSNQNTLEDPRMMAFFDSLIQQEIEGWNTNNTSDSDLCSIRSSGNSTRQSSTESSDEELVNYFVHSRDRHRRGAPNTTIKPQRTKYANRIAYLIATKRNTLRRLALKGASQSNRRRQNSLKNSKRKNHTQRTVPRTSRSGNSVKRVGRFSALSTRTRREEPEQPKNNRYKNHNHTSVFRSFRRKNKNYRVLDRSDTSSEDEIYSQAEPDLLTNGQSEVATSSSVNFAIPSTSTGITSNGKDIAFRLRQQQSDSDDDNSPIHTPTVNPTSNIPINGLQNANQTNNIHNANTTTTTNLSSDLDEERYRSPSTNRRKRPGTVDLDIYSSHSNSRLSNSSYLEDEHSSNESLDCFSKKQLFVPNNNNNNHNNINNNHNYNNNSIETSSQSDTIGKIINSNNASQVAEVKTPNGNIKVNSNLNCTPDSGISNTMAGCSSSSSVTSNSVSCNNNNINNNHNCVGNEKGDKFAIKLFHQKIARVRRNYRKKFGDDSESD